MTMFLKNFTDNLDFDGIPHPPNEEGGAKEYKAGWNISGTVMLKNEEKIL